MAGAHFMPHFGTLQHITTAIAYTMIMIDVVIVLGLVARGAQGFIRPLLPHVLSPLKAVQQKVAVQQNLELYSSLSGNQDDDKMDKFINVMRNTLEGGVNEKVGCIREHTKALIGATIESFETAYDWWIDNGTHATGYHGFVYGCCSDGFLNPEDDDLEPYWIPNDDLPFRLFCGGERFLEIEWRDFGRLFLSNEAMVPKEEIKDTKIDKVETSQTQHLEWTRWNQVEEMDTLIGREIRAAYLGCCANYFSTSSVSLSAWNILIFDLGDCWLEVSCGLDENYYEVHNEKPNFHMIKCA